MKGKVLSSALSIFAATALLVGATYAVFTDSETNTGNTFATGELVVSLDGDNNDGDPVDEGPFFNITGLEPNDEVTEFACVEIRNDGDMDMLFRSYADNLVEEPTGVSLSEVLMVRSTLNSPDCLTPEGYTRYGPPGPVVLYEDPLSGLVGEGNALDNLDAAFDNEDPLEPGFAATYKVEVWLPFDTGNDYQGASLTSDMVVDATQFEGQVDKESVQW